MSTKQISGESLFDLLDKLKELDVKLFLEEGQLRYNAPKGVLDESMLNQLKASKQHLVSFLQLQQRAAEQLDEPIPSGDPASGYPLSFAQQRFWFLDQLAGGNSPIYNMLPIVLQVEGPLKIESLRKALEVLVSRHQVLSNRFSIEGDQPRQWPGQPGKVEITRYDLTDGRNGKDHISRIIMEEGERPFDLSRGGSLLRMGLIRLAEKHHILVLTLHHIVADGWSMGNLVAEFSQLYQASADGKEVALEPLPIQYGDFAVWERGRLNERLLERYLHFWKRELSGAPALLELPADRPRPRLQSYNGRTHAFMLDKDQARLIRECANRHGATPFMVLLTVFGILLSRYSRQEDLVIGSPMSVRVHPDCEPLIGLFLNTIPLRIDLFGNPVFTDLLLRVKRRALAAYEHGEVPFDELLQTLNIGRALNHTPLFQVLFALQNAPVGKLDAGELTITPMEPENSKAPFDLVLSMEELEEGIRGRFRYNTDLFDRQTIVRMGDHFRNILTQALSNSNQPVRSLDMIGEPERSQLLEWRGTGRVFSVKDSISGMIEQRAREYPDAVALVCEDLRWTNSQLNRTANGIAQALLEMGVKPGDRVGVCMSRSAVLIASILAILKTGAAYVPLDPAYPVERLEYMVKDAGIDVVVTDPEAADSVPPQAKNRLNAEDIVSNAESAHDPGIPVDPDMAAYVIYTSGSTGRPKGVEVTHANVVRLFLSTEELFGFDETDVWTLFHSYAFDFSVWEIFGALFYGGRLVVVPYWISRSPDAFYELLHKEKVTVLNQTPSAFRQLIEIDRREGGKPFSLKWVIFGGEALELKSLEGWCERHGYNRPRLINMYGITETTVHVTYHRITEADITRGVSVIGHPIPDLSIDLFDEDGNRVPVGVPGEILVGGAGVANGYLNRTELTSERFVPESVYGFSGDEKLYRSGDLARRLPDGTLEYLGRIDQQLKIRGFRIEPGEIESRISEYPGVAAAVVIARPAGTSSELTGYVVFQSDTDDDDRSVSAIRSYLKEKLPDYMVPAAMVIMDALPLTTNGKVDRNALPEPGRERRDDHTDYIAPSSPLELLIARLWQEVLQVDKVGTEDHFFELGGDSIKGAIFANKMQQQIGSVFYVVSLFEAPTIRELIDYMRIHYPEAVQKFEGGGQGEQTLDRKPDLSDLEAFKSVILPLPTFPEATRPPKNRRAIFVLAPPRSGTTLLRVLLGGHSSLFAPPELELMPFNTLAQRRQVNTGRDAFWLEGTIRAVMELRGVDAETAKELMAERESAGMSVKAFYAEIQEWLGDRILVDKSPSYVLDTSILERIENTFDNPFYIHLHRHPLGMIHSFDEAKLHQIFFRYPHNFTPKRLAELIWLHSHQNISGFLAGIPKERQIRVAFEDLTAMARQEIERMCGRIGIEFEPEMLAIYEEEEKKKRMTDGIYRESKMLGDVKFHTHKRIDAGVANRWQDHYTEDFLSDMTLDKALELGYEPLNRSEDRSGPASAAAVHPHSSAPLPAAPVSSYASSGPSSIAPAVSSGGQRELSLSQKRLWFLDQLDGGNTYNMPVALWLIGGLNIEALMEALKSIPRRHEVLRSCIMTDDGEPVCTILDDLPPPAIVDLSHLPPELGEREALRWMESESNRAFDLARGPLFRSGLVKVTSDRYLLMINMHHIVSDGWSLGIVSNELERFYNAFAESGRPEIQQLNLQYVDYALWQKELSDSGELERQLEYWKNQLRDVPALLELPADRPRPPIKSYKGNTYRFQLDRKLVSQLKKLSEKSGSTMYMTFLAAFGLLMSRYSGQKIIPVGSPVANRRNIDFEPLIGFFVNTLVMKVPVEGDETFRELLQNVRRVALEAYAHQDISFEQLVDEIQPERNLGHSPLFQVMLTMQSMAPELPELNGLQTLVAEHTNPVSKYDLTLLLSEDNGGFHCYLEYSVDLFDEWRMVQLGENFTELLNRIAADPDEPVKRLSLLPSHRQKVILNDWNHTHTKHSYSVPLPELISRRAAETPNRTILICGEEVMTFDELERRSNRLAHHLLELGVDKQSRIAVATERSADMVVALLAILKAGCCYVPLDPGYPSNRIEMIFEDAEIGWLITHSRVSPSMPPCKNTIHMDELSDSLSKRPEHPPAVDIDPEDLAYVIFTSGSTGRPKGVMIPHRAVLNFLFSMVNEPGITDADTILAVTTIAFDIAVLELWAPLITGARIVIATEADVRDGQALAELLEKHEVTIMQATPATWRLMIDHGWTGTPGLKCLCGGEAFPRQLAQDLLQRCSEVWNMYGPTETTVWSTIYPIQLEVSDRDSVEPIGRPISNTSIYILDSEGNPVPPGVPGELYIGGDGVAAGYLNRPDLTAERFIEDSFTGKGTIYRTGDLARYRFGGLIEYLGRADQQVKLRGFRIEPGEIEFQLRQIEGVVQCAVVLQGEGDHARLAAFYVSGDGGSLSPTKLKTTLSGVLPDYMVPSVFYPIEELPLTPNGKLDRKALMASIEHAVTQSGIRSGSARDLTELRLLKIWQELLGIRGIGPDDNFFDAGGHSLIAVRLMSRISSEFGRHLPLAVLFQHPTVSGLAKHVTDGDEANVWNTLIEIRKGDEPGHTLYCAPGAGGNVLYLQPFSQFLQKEITFTGLQPPGLDGITPVVHRVEDLAAHYLRAIREVQPDGPFLLSGHSFGGMVAFEMARQLIRDGSDIGQLILIDTPAPQWYHPTGLNRSQSEWLAQVAQIAGHQYAVDTDLSAGDFENLKSDEERLSLLHGRLIECGVLPHHADINQFRGFIDVYRTNLQMDYKPEPGVIDVEALVIRSADLQPENLSDEQAKRVRSEYDLGWNQWISGPVQVVEVPGDHLTMLNHPNAEYTAEAVNTVLTAGVR